MVVSSRAFYNGSYTMAARPIKSLELHYTMIQFLIKVYILIHNFYYRKREPAKQKSCALPAFNTLTYLLADLRYQLETSHFVSYYCTQNSE